MNPAAIAYAISLLGQLPALISAGRSVIDLVQTGTAALKAMQAEGREPTDAEWDDMNARIRALRDELHDA